MLEMDKENSIVEKVIHHKHFFLPLNSRQEERVKKYEQIKIHEE